MRPHLFHLFALDLTTSAGSFPLRVTWSDAADPGGLPPTWSPGPDNQAGFVDLADTPGALMAAETLRDTLLIYKTDAVYAADFVGGSQIYAFRSLFRGIGAISPRAVAVTPEGHIFVTESDIMITDGNTVRSIATAKVRKRIFNALNQLELGAIFAFYNPLRRETMIGIPTAGFTFPDYMLVWSHDSQAWGVADGNGVSDLALGVYGDQTLSIQWDQDAQAWDADVTYWNESPYKFTRLVVGTIPQAPELRAIDTTLRVVRDAYVEKADMHFGEPERVKYVKRVHVRRDSGSGDLFVRVGSRMFIDGPITWSPTVWLLADAPFANVRVSGRYITVNIQGFSDANWIIHGIDLEVELRGYR